MGHHSRARRRRLQYNSYRRGWRREKYERNPAAKSNEILETNRSGKIAWQKVNPNKVAKK